LETTFEFAGENKKELSDGSRFETYQQKFAQTETRAQLNKAANALSTRISA
jgi:hypothetical protein